MLPTTHFAPSPQKLPTGPTLGSTTMVCVTALAGVPAFVRQAFGERTLRYANHAAMLDIDAIEDQDCFIPHSILTTYMDEVAKRSGEEHLGLIVVPHISIASKGCWAEYMLEAPTLREAIVRGIATIGFHSRGDVLSLTSADGEARLSFASPAKGRNGYIHVACGTAGIILSLCRAFLPADWRPLRIELDVPRPRNPWIFEDTFECPVVFDSDAPGVSAFFEASRLLSPSRRAGAHALMTVGDIARARADWRKLGGLRDVIVQQAWSQVLTGRVSIESAARSMETSVRSLQRELHREGISFRSLANDLRARRAIELLRDTDASIASISTTIGYSAPAHFARAFRRATGASPQQFRRS